MAEVLTKEQIDRTLSELDEWYFEDNKLKSEFSFKDFREAITFITRIAFEAEEQVHHPELFNVYNSVNIALSTHDAGDKVTDKDVKLAKKIESLYQK